MQPIIRSEKLSQVHSDIRGPVYVEAMKMIAEGTPVLRLNTGNPATFGFTMPPSVRQALLENADRAVGYCDFRGMPAARRAIAEYETAKGIQGITPEDIFVGNGVSEMAQFAITALLNYGDEILLPSPSYSLWTNATLIAGAKPVFYTCDEQSDWYPDVEDIRRKITSRTRAILIINPNNPTGAIMEKADLEQLVPTIKKHNLIVFSDEIYGELTYDGAKFTSIASLDGMRERTIVISGFSKYFAMTGWRLGYVCAPKEIIDVIFKIHQYAIMCASTAAQYVALGALNASFEDNFKEVHLMRDEYDKRRKYVYERLSAMQLKCFKPRGAFYVFPSVKSTNMDGEKFAYSLLDSKNVAVVPGGAFGKSGKDYVRISYAYSLDVIKHALDLIEEFINEKR